MTLQLGTLEREELHVLLLDTRHRVLDQERLYQGNVSAAVVRIGELFRSAVQRHASAIILCHNHPSGDTEPSPDDLHLTAEAITAGRLLDIAVLDHLIVAGGTHLSLRERGIAFTDSVARSAAREERGEWQRPRPRLRLQGEAVIGPGGVVHDVDEAIGRLPWRWALPGSVPRHQYCVFWQCPTVAWDVLATAIRDHSDSFDAYFRGYIRPMHYWEHAGWRYWRTAAGRTHMLNRCTLDSVEPPRRVDEGAQPIHGWVGLVWARYGTPVPAWYVAIDRWPWYRYVESEDPRARFSCRGCGRRDHLALPDRPCPRCQTPPDPAVVERLGVPWDEVIER